MSAFKVNTSIFDFSPLFRDMEYLFRGLKETGVDGVELIVGYKSRWSVKRMRYLSEKYDLPIVSLHQPAWSGFGLTFFDEGFVDLAKTFGAKGITFHPLMNMSFADPRMKKYLEKLREIREKKQIDVFLENLPVKYEPGLLNTFFHSGLDTTDVEKVAQITREYGIKMTFDIDHAHVPSPHQEAWFSRIFSQIGNVHLSSFSKDANHLPLDMGDFHIQAFLQELHRKNYQGLFTLELHYPSLFTFFGYDFAMIKRSVDIVHGVTV
ncbi:MAG TPA: TIM barrel protein [Patescibacteria group bacterium]|nr:TIM barrel protein [Patescibacteria group bacterium]